MAELSDSTREREEKRKDCLRLQLYHSLKLLCITAVKMQAPVVVMSKYRIVQLYLALMSYLDRHPGWGQAGGKESAIVKHNSCKDVRSTATLSDRPYSNFYRVADIIRSCLGPKAMLKMLLDPMGGIVLTNDGHAILREIEVAHPAAKSMIELSRTQDEEVGDGTTTVIILGMA